MTCRAISVVRRRHPVDWIDPPRKGSVRLSEAQHQVVRDVTVANKEGLHARPVMSFVDLASTFQSDISVSNVTRKGDTVDGKSAMQMMLLEATSGNVLRIKACGADANEAVEALAGLVQAGFNLDGISTSN